MAIEVFDDQQRYLTKRLTIGIRLKTGREE